MSAPPPPDNLPAVTRHITTHGSDGKAIVHSSTQGPWSSYDGGQMAFNVLYTTTFPPDVNADADIHAHNAVAASGQLGLVNPSGTVCRMVDFAPGYEAMMHRTKSLDYGIVLEGEVDMVLDSGEVTRMKRGDVAVQRATMHSWRNPSTTQWARMIFVLQDAQQVVVAGQTFGEDHGRGTEGIPKSKN